MTAAGRRNALGFHKWDDFPRTQNLRKGTMRRAVTMDHLTVQRGEMAPDTEFDDTSIHRHPEDQIIVVLEGKMRLRIGEDEGWICPGGFAAIPAGVFHSATDAGPEGSTYIEILSSGRMDYLAGYVGLPKNEFKFQKG